MKKGPQKHGERRRENRQMRQFVSSIRGLFNPKSKSSPGTRKIDPSSPKIQAAASFIRETTLPQIARQEQSSYVP